MVPIAGMGKRKMEMFVLRSRAIAERVADSLNMTLVLMSPRVPRSEVTHPVAMAGSDGAQGLYMLTRRAGGSYALKPGTEREVPVRHDSLVVPGMPFRVGNTTMELDPSVRADGPEEIRFGIRSRRAAASAVRDGVRVAQPDPDALVVEIGYTGGTCYGGYGYAPHENGTNGKPRKKTKQRVGTG